MTAVDVKPSNVGIVDLAVPQRCSYSRTWRCLKKTSGLSFCQQPSFFNKVEPSESCSKIAGLSDLFCLQLEQLAQKHYYPCRIPRSIPNMKYATPCLWDCLTCPCLSQASMLAYEVIRPVKTPTSTIDTELQLLATKPTPLLPVIISIMHIED